MIEEILYIFICIVIFFLIVAALFAVLSFLIGLVVIYINWKRDNEYIRRYQVNNYYEYSFLQLKNAVYANKNIKMCGHKDVIDDDVYVIIHDKNNNEIGYLGNNTIELNDKFIIIGNFIQYLRYYNWKMSLFKSYMKANKKRK